MARRATLVVCLVLSLALVAVKKITLKAQSLPVTKQLAWDMANAVSDGVTDYTITFDGVARTVPATVACTPDPSKCSVAQTFATIGPHTISVTATNLWSTSAPALLTVTVTLPRSPTGITIK